MSDFLFVKSAIVDNLQKRGVYIAWFVHLSGDVYSVCVSLSGTCENYSSPDLSTFTLPVQSYFV